MPRSVLVPHKWPSAATYTMSGFVGWITTRPIERVSFNPMCVHFLPPSLDLYTPSPHHWERRLFFSPVPTHTTFVSDGATARSPIVWTPNPSATDCQVIPPLDVFHTPPPAAPMQNVFQYSRVRGTASAGTRP